MSPQAENNKRGGHRTVRCEIVIRQDSTPRNPCIATAYRQGGRFLRVEGKYESQVIRATVITLEGCFRERTDTTEGEHWSAEASRLPRHVLPDMGLCGSHGGIQRLGRIPRGE